MMVYARFIHYLMVLGILLHQYHFVYAGGLYNNSSLNKDVKELNGIESKELNETGKIFTQDIDIDTKTMVSATEDIMNEIAQIPPEIANGPSLPDGREIFLFPSYGRFNATTGTWMMNIHCIVFKRVYSQRVFSTFQLLFGKPKTMEERLWLQERASYMTSSAFTNYSGLAAVLTKLSGEGIGLTETIPLVTTDSGGHSEGQYNLTKIYGDGFVRVVVKGFNSTISTTETSEIAQTGKGLIVMTDIDDTVKATGVMWYPKMFKNAFFRRYLPVEKMDILFHDWTQILTVNNTKPLIAYVSGTPWQLFKAESYFFKDYYPYGSIELARFSFADGSWKKLPDYMNFKRNQFRNYANQFPDRKFVLVGDSGQHDAEAYASIMTSDLSERIQCIFIRKVHGDWVRREKPKNTNKRFQIAFAKVPKNKWYAFDKPEELYEIDIKSGKCRK